MRSLKRILTILLAVCVMLSAFALAPAVGAANTIYLDASAVTLGNETWYVWTWGGVADTWIKADYDSQSGYLKFENVGSYVIFARMDAAQKPSWNDGILWNRTGDLYVENNMYVITGWGSGYGSQLPGYWREYVVTTSPSDLRDTETAYYELADSVNDGMILQAWNWSYENTIAMLDKVKAAGFTTIQISPPQVICGKTKGRTVNDSSGGWWAYYQPTAFKINDLDDNALGTKTELLKLISAAHQKGMKIIADAVINHVAGNGNTSNSDTNPNDHVHERVKILEPELYEKGLFHTPWVQMSYKERYSDGYSDYDIEEDLTQHAQSNLPDLNTADPFVQEKIFSYLKELVDAGIDGFRVDAAKHIETPSDTYFGSDFLPNTLGKIKEYAKTTYRRDLLTYGEIIGTCGDGRSFDEYTPYMKVSDTGVYWDIANNVNGGDAARVIPMNTYNTSKEKTVLWNETHDSFVDGSTRGCSEVELNKRWAACAARDTITSMYLARPNSINQYLGEASESYWANWSVREVNNFSNIFAGQGEYLSNGSNVAVIGRGDKYTGGGAVLINCDNGTTKSVSGVPVYTLANGTYHDRISGNEFYVNNNSLSGTIGSTGIAVLYKDQRALVYADESQRYYGSSIDVSVRAKRVDYATYEYNGCAPVSFSERAKITLGKAGDSVGATYKLTVKGYLNGKVAAEQSYEYTKDNPDSAFNITLNTNSISGWSSTPYIYAWNSQTGEKLQAWPGMPMYGGSGAYIYALSGSFDRVLFNCGSSQTVNIPVFDSSVYTVLGTTEYNDDRTLCNQVSSVPVQYSGQKYYPDPNATEPAATTAPAATTQPATLTEASTVTTEPTTAVFTGKPRPTTVPAETTTEVAETTAETTAVYTGRPRPTTVPATVTTEPEEASSTPPQTTEPAEAETESTTAFESATSAPTTITELFTTLAPATEETAPGGIIGDVNGDSCFDVRDATEIKRYVAKVVDFTAEQYAAADVNNDGGVDIRDATKMQRVIAKVDTFDVLIGGEVIELR